jgi:hypothetical protein
MNVHKIFSGYDFDAKRQRGSVKKHELFNQRARATLHCCPRFSLWDKEKFFEKKIRIRFLLLQLNYYQIFIYVSFY